MSPARILVVDDEPFNVDYLEQELVDRGYIVDTAFSGREAIQHVEVDPPDLILLDIVMPEMDGFEVIRILKERAQTQLIPIIIMTALSAREDRIRGKSLGADDFLTKPVDEVELRARIQSALRMKAAVDAKLGELASATAGLERMRHSSEATVVAVRPAEFDASRELVERFRAAGAHIQETQTDETLFAVFEGGSPEESAREALEAIDGVSSAIGVSYGEVTVEADRDADERGGTWDIKFGGQTVTRARDIVAHARDGQVLIDSTVSYIRGGDLSGTSAGIIDGSPLFDVSHSEQPETSPIYEIEFPPEFTELSRALREQWEVEDLYLTRTLSGLSGARVYAADITCRGFSGQAILKMERLEATEWEEAAEAERHATATARNEAFAAAHLPRLVHALQHGGAAATLSTIAAGGLEYCLAWFRTPYEHQLNSARLISRDLLEGWNAEYRLAPGLVVPHHLLTEWLDYRLDPESGRIHAFISERLGAEPLTPTLVLDGRWYPNPLVFALGRDPNVGAPPLRAIRGQTHGDLHGHNVLTRQRRADASDYFMIDLAFYQPDSFLLFDHGYFELAYLLSVRESASARRWLRFVDAIERGVAEEADDIGVVAMVAAIRDAVRGWIIDFEENRLSYMQSQTLIGRIGAGLNFTHKRVPPLTKTHAFLYAAAAAKSYVKLHGLDWPRAGTSIDLEA